MKKVMLILNLFLVIILSVKLVLTSIGYYFPGRSEIILLYVGLILFFIFEVVEKIESKEK